jgi:hypothetical protein
MKPVTYLAPELRLPFWHFVGECGLTRKGDHLTESTDEYVFWLRMGIAFLHHTFGEPPSDWVLDILWAQAPHGEGKFPIIAIGFNNDEESAEVKAYADELDKDLQIFNDAVDWRAIASSPSPHQAD